MEIVNIITHKTKNYVYCGRGSIFGNPFEIGRDGTRAEVIAKYAKWFNHLIKDKRFRDEVFKLQGQKCGCYCIPLQCHLEVIKEYLDNFTPI